MTLNPRIERLSHSFGHADLPVAGDTLIAEQKHHFFGYYGMNPWDQAGERHLALSVASDEQPPGYLDRASFGYVDRADGQFHRLGTTAGWNLQQGCMAHWVMLDGKEYVSVNELVMGDDDVPGTAAGGDICATRVHDLAGEIKRFFPTGLCALAADGHAAYGLDFVRMYHCRTVVGYTNPIDKGVLVKQPHDNGIFSFDLRDDGTAPRLLVSIDEVLKRSSVAVPKDAIAWINHVLPNPDNSAVVFVCRYNDGTSFRTSLWSMNSDASELIEEIPFGGHVSHFCWRDNQTVIVSTNNQQRHALRFMSLRRGSRRCVAYGAAALLGDSHLCFSPDGRWAIGDRYPDAEGISRLFLFDPETEQSTGLGEFLHPPMYRGDIRCDLHPRWSADSRSFTFDSIHEGTRQIYQCHLFD